MLHDSWRPLAGPKGMSGIRVAIRPACQPAATIQRCIVLLFHFKIPVQVYYPVGEFGGMPKVQHTGEM